MVDISGDFMQSKSIYDSCRGKSVKSFKDGLVKEISSLSILILINLVIYREYWLGVKIFTGKDLLTAFSLLLNFQTDCLKELSLPLWNPFLNFGYPFVEHYSNTVFFPTHLIMGLFTGSSIEIIQREIMFWIFAGGFGIYLCVREFGHSRVAGIIAGTSFMFCGQLTALPQWHVLVYNATCFPFLLLGYHRAKRKGHTLSLVSVAFLAMTIYGGHVTTSVLGIYIFVMYVIVDSLMSRNIFFGIRFLFLTLLLSGLLTLPKTASMYQAMALGPRMKAPESLHTKDPSNIINAYNFMSYILPVKYYFSLYIGQVGIMALIYGIIRKRVSLNGLLVTFILTAWFLTVGNEGNVSLFRSAMNILPLMKLVRNEWLEWFYPSIFAILYLSKYVDEFLAGGQKKFQMAASFLFVAFLTAIFILEYNAALYFKAYLVHIALAFLWGSLIFLTERKKAQFFLAVVLVTAEFFIVFNRVNVDEPPVREGDRIKIAVVDQGSVSPSYMDDNSVRFKFYAVAVQDHLRPSISDSRNWPYLISGMGGAGTINAYPEQYGNFIDYMNLKRFSGWWYNGQEKYDFIQIKDSPLLQMLDNQPLYVFYSNKTANPIENAVFFDEISCSDFAFTVKSQEPGFFLLRQMYDDRWNVFVDGGRRDLQHADEFFMGADVEPGEHKIKFVFRDKLFNISLIISIITLAGILSVVVIKRFNPKIFCRRAP